MKKVKNDLDRIQKNFYTKIRRFGKGAFKPPQTYLKKEGILFMAKKKRKAKKATKRRSTGTKKRKSGLSQNTYSLSPELQAVCGSRSLTRPQIVKKLWAYIKSHKCQDTKNRRLIVPDKKLSEVIGKKPVDMMKLAGLLSKHIK